MLPTLTLVCGVSTVIEQGVTAVIITLVRDDRVATFHFGSSRPTFSFGSREYVSFSQEHARSVMETLIDSGWTRVTLLDTRE